MTYYRIFIFRPHSDFPMSTKKDNKEEAVRIAQEWRDKGYKVDLLECTGECIRKISF